MKISLPKLVRMYEETNPACEQRLIPTHRGIDGPVELWGSPRWMTVPGDGGTCCDKLVVAIHYEHGYRRYLIVDELGVELPADWSRLEVSA